MIQKSSKTDPSRIIWRNKTTKEQIDFKHFTGQNEKEIVDWSNREILSMPVLGSYKKKLSHNAPNVIIYIKRTNPTYPIPLNYYIIKKSDKKFESISPEMFKNYYEMIVKPLEQ